jgi:ADP-ribose pyrophosphatase YjhB (NUDIX family)
LKIKTNLREVWNLPEVGARRNSIHQSTTIPLAWKLRLARLVKIRFVQQLMVWGIHLVVPRHRVGVGLVLFNEQRQILLLRHVFHPHTPWGLPGGWLERNESPEMGALRELREETGLTAVLGPIVHVSRDPHPAHLGIAYLADVEPGPITLSGEIIEAAWFHPNEMPPLLPFAQETIHKAVGVSFRAKGEILHAALSDKDFSSLHSSK